MGASDLTIHNKRHQISRAGVYLRKVSTTDIHIHTHKEKHWPTFQKKSTEVGVKNGKQRITRITCHCLFSLKKCQSVCFSGVLLFSCCLCCFSSSRRSPVDCKGRSKPSFWRNVNISGERSDCASHHLCDTEPGPTPRNYLISGGPLRARRHQPEPPVRAENSLIPTQCTHMCDRKRYSSSETKINVSRAPRLGIWPTSARYS